MEPNSRLRDVRVAHGYSARGLAEAVTRQHPSRPLTADAVYAYERGRVRLTADMAERIARTLEVDSSDILLSDSRPVALPTAYQRGHSQGISQVLDLELTRWARLVIESSRKITALSRRSASMDLLRHEVADLLDRLGWMENTVVFETSLEWNESAPMAWRLSEKLQALSACLQEAARSLNEASSLAATERALESIATESSGLRAILGAELRAPETGSEGADLKQPSASLQIGRGDTELAR